MSTTTYNASLRGKLVNVSADNSVLVYKSASKDDKTSEYITGPETTGTATGYTTVDGTTVLIEVLRVTSVLFVPVPTKIYLLRENVVIANNPNYDPAKDLDRPSDSTSTGGGTTTGGKDPYDNGDIDIIVEKPPKTTPPVIDEKGPGGDDTTQQRKWLTYGLYAILGMAAITLTVILVKSAKTPKVKKA